MDNTSYVAIACSLIVLLGVLITLLQNQRIVENNRREERQQAKEERDFNAKHKAFLSATASVIRFFNYYLTIADIEIPRDGKTNERLTEMSIALNRLHFYCDIETIRTTMAVGKVLNQSYAKALKAKMPSMFIGEEIKAIDLQISAKENMNNMLQQEILGLLSTDSKTPLILSHRQQIISNLNSITEFYAKKNNLIMAKWQATEACRDVINQSLKEIYEAFRDSLLIVRKELAFSINEHEYATMITQSQESALVYMENFLNDVRTEIKTKLNEFSQKKP
jgi:hypothetical protein